MNEWNINPHRGHRLRSTWRSLRRRCHSASNATAAHTSAGHGRAVGAGHTAAMSARTRASHFSSAVGVAAAAAATAGASAETAAFEGGGASPPARGVTRHKAMHAAMARWCRCAQSLLDVAPGCILISSFSAAPTTAAGSMCCCRLHCGVYVHAPQHVVGLSPSRWAMLRAQQHAGSRVCARARLQKVFTVHCGGLPAGVYCRLCKACVFFLGVFW
jgi:hypothetical protein